MRRLAIFRFPFRRVLLWSPLPLGLLFLALLGIQMMRCPGTTRILVMCIDDVDTLGLDPKRPVYLSDVMLVVETHVSQHEVVCTQVPRDTLAYICPQLGFDKVNTGIAVAGADKDRAIVGSLISRRIDRYVVIRTRDFQRFFQIFGDIQVPAGSYDLSANTASEKASRGTINNQLVVLKGMDIVHYAIDRTNTDVERRQRQKVLMNAVIDRRKQMGVAEFSRLIAWTWNLDSDISLIQMAQIGRLCSKSRFEFRTLPTGSIYLNGAADLLSSR